MQDRFSFRVFDYDENKMVYFSSLIGIETPHHDRSSKPNLYNDYVYHKISNYMQCTGLKDRNGKLIYEGDILKVKGKQTDETIGFVEWLNDFGKFSLNVDSCCVYTDLDYLPENEREIIGNIYQNTGVIEWKK